MFGFIKKVFLQQWHFFSCNELNVNSLDCVSINNQECKIRSEIINVNTNEPMFYPCSIKINKAVVILLMTHMISDVFLILLKT